jgi:hypothetical protein
LVVSAPDTLGAWFAREDALVHQETAGAYFFEVPRLIVRPAGLLLAVCLHGPLFDRVDDPPHHDL